MVGIALSVNGHDLAFNFFERQSERFFLLDGFMAEKDSYSHPYKKRKDLDTLWIMKEFGDLNHHPLCWDATKFREVESLEHSTSLVLNLTHPVGV
jgi:hypothetical protein